MKKKDINLIRKIFDLGLIPTLLNFMKSEASPHLVLESTWCVANLTIGDQYQIEFMIKRGLLEILKKLLISQHMKIVEQAVWVVANLAADSFELKIDMLKMGYAEILTKSVIEMNDAKIMAHFVWALSNLCRGQKVHKSQVHAISAFFKAMAILNAEEEVIYHCINPINDILEKKILKSLIESNFLKILMMICMTHGDSMRILTPLVQILCTVSCISSVEIKKMADHGFIEVLFKLLKRRATEKSFIKEILYTLSNFLVDSDEIIGLVFRTKEHFDILMALCQDNSISIKREAIWCISNVTKTGSNERIHGLVQNGIFKTFKNNLYLKQDSQILMIIIEGMENILKCQKKMQMSGKTGPEYDYMRIIEESGIFDCLETLQTHKVPKVYRAVISLLEENFEEDCQGDVLSYFNPREDVI